AVRAVATGRLLMKKRVLLAGVATLSALTAAAHPARAGEIVPEIPSIEGEYCLEQNLSDNQRFHFLPDDSCENPGFYVGFRPTGYTGMGKEDGWARRYCEFVKIEDITPPLNGKEPEDNPAIYLVRAECKSGWGDAVVPPWTENFELETTEGQIIITLYIG